jgi:Uma2 family endonuclease
MRETMAPWRQPPLTQEEEDDLFMLLLADDTEDAPWMVMGDLQFWSASQFAASLRSYAHQRRLPWYVASMHPIQYSWPNTADKKTLAPDVYVAFVAERARSSYDVEAEGQFPAFVLEVVSPSSQIRDTQNKRRAYEMLGVKEYVLFTPRANAPSMLSGYRRNAEGKFEPWRQDANGRLKSEVLGLTLLVDGDLLRAETPEGRILPTLEEAELDQAREAQARQVAEEEVDRLRRDIARLRREST